jgi:hypothetical protein
MRETQKMQAPEPGRNQCCVGTDAGPRGGISERPYATDSLRTPSKYEASHNLSVRCRNALIYKETGALACKAGFSDATRRTPVRPQRRSAGRHSTPTGDATRISGESVRVLHQRFPLASASRSFLMVLTLCTGGVSWSHRSKSGPPLLSLPGS